MDEKLRHVLLSRLPIASRRRDRDREIVAYVGRHGAVSIENVMSATGIGRTMAYRRVARCVEAGLLERLAILHSEPSVLRATREGLRYAGLPLPLAEVSPGSVRHALRCASVAHALEHQHDQHDPSHILTEREIAYYERLETRPFASCKLGASGSGVPQLHRPDLAVIGDDGRVVAIEVELTAKSPSRLAAIIKGWRDAHWVSGVEYFTSDVQTNHALQRAVAAVGARRKVRIVDELARI